MIRKIIKASCWFALLICVSDVFVQAVIKDGTFKVNSPVAYVVVGFAVTGLVILAVSKSEL